MSVKYKLTLNTGSTTQTKDGKILPSLVRIDEVESQNCEEVLVESISPVEFKEMNIYQENENYSPVTIIQSESNFVDVYPECIVGSFSVPTKSTEAVEPTNLAFYMDNKQLIFVDEGTFSAKLIEDIANSGMLNEMSTAHCLFLAFKMMLIDDLEYLSHLEDDMEDIEENMLIKHKEIDTMVIMGYRRLTMRLASFYQQLTTMATILSENENHLMTKQDARMFTHSTVLTDRLGTKAETLKEYSLQLHEMHQTRIDLQQNSIMQVLTIVTVLIAPMTLITGWFGMNLQNLPGIGVGPMWAILIIAFIACTALLLLLFKKKKWL